MTSQAPVTAEVLSDLIGSIYDCALDADRWPATLSALHQNLDCASAALTLHALPSGEQLVNVTCGIDQPWLERMPDYTGDIVQMWGGAEGVRRFPLDEPMVGTMVVEKSAWEANRYHREWASPQGLIDLLLLTLSRDWDMVGTIGMGRHASAGPIGSRELDAARLLMPHLQRAVAISRLLELKTVVTRTFESAFDALTAAVILVDVDLRIIYANRAAQSMLRVGDPIRSQGSLLAARSPAAAAALIAAVQKAAENEAQLGRRGFGVPLPCADGKPCVLHVLPLQQGVVRPNLSPSAAAAIFVAPAVFSEPTQSEVLAALFDLTTAEARVFTRIAAGMTPSETARELGVAVSTVKTHLIHLFTKTGARRQADLARLSASLSLPL